MVSLVTSTAQKILNPKEVSNEMVIIEGPKGKTSHIAVAPQPLKLTVETPTDWPTVLATLLVGIGSILITSMVGWLSYSSQRSQIRSNTANFRHKWGDDLREASAQFFATVALIKFELDGNAAFISQNESNKLFSDLVTAQFKIGLMLDKKQPYTVTILNLLSETIEHLKLNKPIDLNDTLNKLHDELNAVLEKTWADIKNDLKGKSKK